MNLKKYILDRALAFSQRTWIRVSEVLHLRVRHSTNLILFLVFKIIMIIYLFYLLYRIARRIK